MGDEQSRPAGTADPVSNTRADDESNRADLNQNNMEPAANAETPASVASLEPDAEARAQASSGGQQQSSSFKPPPRVVSGSTAEPKQLDAQRCDEKDSGDVGGEDDNIADTNPVDSDSSSDSGSDDDSSPKGAPPPPIRLIITSPDGQERDHTEVIEEKAPESEHMMKLRSCMKRDVSNVDLMSLGENRDFADWLQASDAVWAADIRDYPAGTPLLNDGVIPEDQAHFYIFEHAGLRCELSRNAFLAWTGTVTLPETHPLYDVRISEMTSSGLTVHGGITSSGRGLIGFDCHHGATDIAPYEGYASNRMKVLKQLVGKMADEKKPANEASGSSASSSSAAEGSLRNTEGMSDPPEHMDTSNLVPPQFLRKQVPWAPFGKPGRRCYKNYNFAKKQLCSLAEQLARKGQPAEEGNPQDS